MKLFSRLAALVLALMMAAAVLPAAAEDMEISYGLQIGDKMADFTATFSDGTTVTLADLLATKEAILINFWATWCGPCREEFPFMQEAYDKVSDKVAVVALSVEDTDDAAVIENFKAENGLTTLTLGHDDTGVSDNFYFDGIPTSLLVDRFGVICWMETGSITSAEEFDHLFMGFLGDDYTESKVGYVIPGPKPTVPNEDPAALSAALNAEGSTLAFVNAEGNEYAWPFCVTETGIVPSNVGIDKTTAFVETTVTAAEGDVFAVNFTLVSEPACDDFTITVDGEIACRYSGTFMNATAAVALTEGEHVISITYAKDAYESAADEMLVISKAALLQGEAAAAALEAAPKAVQTLEGKAMTIIPMTDLAKEIKITEPTGEFEAAYSDFTILLIPEDHAVFHVQLGAELDPYKALYYGDADYIYYNASTAEQNGDGYDFETALSGVELGGYSSTYVYALPEASGDDYTMLMVFHNEQNVNYFCQVEMVQYYGFSDVTWTYADGTAPSTDEVAEVAGGADNAYVVYVTGPDEEPVQGVMVQVCDDTTCEVFFTDEDGLVYFEKEPYPYEIHILSAPEGYTFDNEAVYVMDDATEGFLFIELGK